MGDRHGGRFARRGRALSPPRRDFPTARCGFPMARGGGQDLPRAGTLPRRKPPDTAHEQKNLPRARTLPSAKASRHGARAKGFAPRRNTPHGKGLPTRRTGERICPARERSPRRRPPERRTGERICPAGFAFTPRADERRAAPDRRTAGKTPLRRGRTRDRARAKGFAPRRNALHGEGLPTRRTSERICPAQKRSPRRRPPDTAHGRKDLPRGVRVRPTCRRTADRPRPTDSRKNTPSAGSHPRRRGRCRVHSPKKIKLLHEIQLFYGESHVGSRQIFPSFPSVDRCVAQERNPVPPFAPHRGRGHRGLRRDGEMCHGFGECPRGGESLPHGGNAWLPHGGRRCPGLRCFGERFHRRRCANPDACGGRRCSRPTFRNRRRSDEKNFRAPRCSRG